VRHFEIQLDELRKRLLEMSGLVESSIYRSVQALVGKDEAQVQQVMDNEARINRMQIEIDELATGLLARQQPMAADLRLITATIKINNDLERMGDHAVNIAERARALLHEPAIRPLIDIPRMASLAESMVHGSLEAFVKKDAESARTVLKSDDAVDHMRDAVYNELVTYMENNSSAIRECIHLMFIARNLERIADHATNIAEDVVFLVEGADVRHHSEVHAQP
jgi:phosphate transport system protein